MAATSFTVALRIHNSAFSSSSSSSSWDGDANQKTVIAFGDATRKTVVAFGNCSPSCSPNCIPTSRFGMQCVNSFAGHVWTSSRQWNSAMASLNLVDTTSDDAHEDSFRQLSAEDDPINAVRAVSAESTSTSELPGVAAPAFLFTRNKEERKVVRTAWEKLVRWSRSWQLMNARRKNALKKTKKVVVLGGGSFGTAMAVLLARNKADMNVTLLLRDSTICDSINELHMNKKYFPRHQLPKNVTATTDARLALQDAQYCVHAIPVQSSTAFLLAIAEHVPATLPFLSVSKGLELSTLEMMSQLIPRALNNPRQPVAVISGPSFAIELMDELPTAMVAASRDKELAKACQQLLASHYLRVNTSTDVVGVEMAGALKNVLAIAAGIVEGMHLGNNCMAALVAQGCSEIRWLAEKMGAKSHTLSGLSGSGDIMLTCFVNLSRNRSVGVRLGSGEKLDEILNSMSQVAEGVATAGAVISLAKKYRVQMPILTAVARILDNELTPKTAVMALMSLPQVEDV